MKKIDIFLDIDATKEELEGFLVEIKKTMNENVIVDKEKTSAGGLISFLVKKEFLDTRESVYSLERAILTCAKKHNVEIQFISF